MARRNLSLNKLSRILKGQFASTVVEAVTTTGISDTLDLRGNDIIDIGSLSAITDNAYDLGSASIRWANIYTRNVHTGDLHLANERGNWTVIEEEDYLTIRNNKTGKIFKLLMQEITGEE